MSAEESGPSRVVIGISFGNSYSSIASVNARAQLTKSLSDRQIPTILSYVAGEEFHGTQAKAQLIRNPKNTVAYFRDFLGQEYGPEHESTIAFSIKDTEEDKENTRTISEITTRHIRRLKNSASDYLGKTVTAAVVTVPTNFTEAQKEALAKAAKDAELEIIQFINEPTSALLAYDARPEAQVSDKIVVVADFGGTRSDLDQVLMDYFAKEFIKKHKSDPRQNERGLAKLKMESEAVKKALSIGQSANFSQFASLTRLVTHAVEKAQLDVLDIDEVILSGGTSHTPKLARNIQLAFPREHRLSHPGHPPMVTLTPHLSKAIGVLCISETAEHGVFSPLVEAETPVPIRKTAVIGTPREGGDVLVKICEGLREIKVEKPEPKPKENGADKAAEEDDSDVDDSDDEPEENSQQGVALKGVKKGAKVEVQLTLAGDLAVNVVVREVGGKGGVRGSI
ncbi:heat shock protein-like protein 70 [Phyllosticta citriasiana]|uniref:heat shock protein-like protein 70 n=1 Tax=Phyllosticta citriasiana TaxID=595635 RepID=UPI0030FD7CEC